MAISDKLTYLNETKTKLKTAINNLGGTITSNDTFRSYVNVLDNIYKYLPKVSGEDTIINLDNTIGAKMEFQLKGNTSQDGTPTPDSPQEIHTVSGDNTVEVGNGKNIFNMKEYASENSGYFTYSSDTGLTAIAKDNRATANVSYPIEVTPSTTYYVKTDTDKRLLISQYNSNNGWLVNNEVFNGGSFTTNANVSYIRVKVADTLTTFPTVVGNVYISTSNDYQKESYPINLGDIELCEIGDYQDYIYKNNGKWYLHKEIGKVLLNGSENWSLFFSTNGIFINNTLISSLNVANTINCISNYFSATTRTNIRNNLTSINNACATNGGELIFANKNITSVNDFKNWLSSNNVTVYYILATPTDTEITDTTLLSQLEALNNSYSYTEQTNISQENSDLPIIIYASTLMGNVEA